MLSRSSTRLAYVINGARPLMSANAKLAKVADEFVRAIQEAKDRSTSLDDLYADDALNGAYRSLFQTVRTCMPKDVEWQSGFWGFVWSFVDSNWEDATPAEIASRGFTNCLLDSLDDLQAIDWIACIPLERAFQRFPEHTDFKDFSIINARATAPHDDETLLSEFRRILTSKLGVTFMPSMEVHNPYARIADHFYQKSGWYIPGRPQLVISIGKGESSANEQHLRSKLRAFAPLLQLCQVYLDQQAAPLENCVVGPHSVQADGKTPMSDGLLRVPPCSVAINRRSGQADWWATFLPQYESRQGRGYDPDAFRSVWNRFASPILALRDKGFSGKLDLAIDNAIRMVARCRHFEFGDLAVNAVIATETVLNPFNAGGDISERFAILVASLTESTSEGRRAKYQLAKSLYRRRCHAVHRSKFNGDEIDAEKQARSDALELFVGCLLAVVQWADHRVETREPINGDAFHSMYLDSVFR